MYLSGLRNLFWFFGGFLNIIKKLVIGLTLYVNSKLFSGFRYFALCNWGSFMDFLNCLRFSSDSLWAFLNSPLELPKDRASSGSLSAPKRSTIIAKIGISSSTPNIKWPHFFVFLDGIESWTDVFLGTAHFRVKEILRYYKYVVNIMILIVQSILLLFS